MITFSDRVFLVKSYKQWIKENSKDCYIKDDPLSFLAYLQEIEVLDEKRIKDIRGNDE